ncbi:receptor [Seminavis robusta]|uniref:Receptor n=1 Tax=Seminavis robusta TaxID=568900 RepID=A0A9N8D5U6_9STRA|nr:receptor [Seminavis robusta]|eukprot:Sro7_g006290.1 receptor (788) ;mRNA; r:217726-220185
MNQRSSDFSVGAGSRNLYQALAPPTPTFQESLQTTLQDFSSPFQHRKTAAVVGSVRSAVSASLSLLAGAYELPQISPASTSSDLDNKDVNPTFARTVPTNRGDVHALIAYLKHLNVQHFNVLYLRDEYGTAFFKKFSIAASYGDNNQGESTEEDVQLAIKKKGIICRITQWRLLNSLYQLGLLNDPNHVWLMSEACSWIIDPGYSTHPGLARAMHGWGYVTIRSQPNPSFVQALNQINTDTQAQEHLISSVIPQTYWGDNFNAMMALGIAACQVSTTTHDDNNNNLTIGLPNFFSGIDFYNQLVQTSFDGASGRVQFNATTGTRSYANFQFSVFNLLFSPQRSDNQTARFDVTETHRVDFSSNANRKTTSENYNDSAEAPLVMALDTPFYYNDNTTNIPAELPPPEKPIELNLISDPVRIAGWTLASIVMALALVALVWVVARRKSNRVIQASQPFFLALICVGAFLMATSTIFLGFQESMRISVLNAGCMLTPWCFSMGFTIAFSALFSKTMRVYKIFQSAAAMRRITVGVRDVAKPMVALACFNLLLLIFWQTLDPLTWQRITVDYNLDPYGRPKESYGSCYVSLSTTQQGFAYSILTINAIPVLVANYMSYKARNIRSDVLNETVWIQISMAAILEIILIGGPFVLVAGGGEETTALYRYVVLTFLFCVTALASFVPLLVSKIWLLRDMKVNSRQSLFSRGSTATRPSFVPPTGGTMAASHMASNTASGGHYNQVDDEIAKQSLRITNRNSSALGHSPSHSQAHSGLSVHGSDEDGHSHHSSSS